MILEKDEKQLTFILPFGGRLKPENRWVRVAGMIFMSIWGRVLNVDFCAARVRNRCILVTGLAPNGGCRWRVTDQ